MRESLAMGTGVRVDQRKQWALAVTVSLCPRWGFPSSARSLRVPGRDPGPSGTAAITGSAGWDAEARTAEKSTCIQRFPPKPGAQLPRGNTPLAEGGRPQALVPPWLHLLHDVCVISCCLSIEKCKSFCIFYFCIPKFMKDYVR